MFEQKGRLSIKASANGKKEVLSYAGGPSAFPTMGFPQGNMSISAIGGYYNNIDTLLYGIFAEDERFLRRYYRDIYYYDTTAGSAIDLMSTLPFSDFTLIGCNSPEQEEVFNASIDQLNLKALMPELSVDYLVNGAFIGTMLYRSQKKDFTDIIVQNIDDCEITPTPFYGMDPLIKLKIGKDIRNFINSNEEYFVKLRQRLNPMMLQAMAGGTVVLDNLTTLFIPRKTFASSFGTSIFRRLIPIYLLEKTLYRGTITEATRRQRSTMLVQVGSEYYEPTDNDLQALVSMFQTADLDPMGAILATRNDVQVQDIRPAGEFWKWTDITDNLNAMKLRALGISETFLSGEATFASMEVSLSVFIEHIRAFRDLVTRRVFTDKLFPLISALHGFKETRSEELHKDNQKEYTREMGGTGFSEPKLQEDQNLQKKIEETSKLLIPHVAWHKHLRPEADREYMDVMNTMAEKGVPITLSAWAAAGGVNLDNLEQDLRDDIKTRKQVAQWAQQVSGITQGIENPNNTENEEEARVKDFIMSHVAGNGGSRLKTFLSRDFNGTNSEVFGETKTGRKKYLQNQTRAQKKQREKIASALRNLGDRAHYRLRVNEAKNKGLLNKNPMMNDNKPI